MIDARACYVWPSEVFVRDSWNSSDKARNKVSSRQISLTTNLARNEKIEKKEKGKKNPLKKKKKKKETIRRRRKKKEVKKIQRYIEKSRHRLTNTFSFFFPHPGWKEGSIERADRDSPLFLSRGQKNFPFLGPRLVENKRKCTEHVWNASYIDRASPWNVSIMVEREFLSGN